MPVLRERSHFPVSLFATPSPQYRDIFYTVPRAGHLVGGSDHHIVREHFPGHEMILCLRGLGWVRVAGRDHPVAPGEFVWINCHRPHEHGADRRDPWEVYWIRVEGPKLAQMSEILGVSTAPVFIDLDSDAASAIYLELFNLVSSDEPETPALIHASVARLLALAFCARQRKRGFVETSVPPVLKKAVDRMKLFYFEKHRVDDLAALSGMSGSHFNRVFRAAFGTTPIDWLRRERISQAKRRLAETDDAIKEIATQVGYADRFFFSKDFKRLTGHTPGEFRRREQFAYGA